MNLLVPKPLLPVSDAAGSVVGDGVTRFEVAIASTLVFIPAG